MFLGAFAKLRKATTSFVMYVRLSVRSHGTTQLPPDGFSWNSIFQFFFFFPKCVKEVQVLLKTDKNNGHSTGRRMYIYEKKILNYYENEKCFRHICREDRNTHVKFSNFFFFSKIVRRSWDNKEKYCRARQATEDNRTHTHCMLDTQDYKHTLIICNTYCFFTATMVARTRLNITFVRTLPVLLT